MNSSLRGCILSWAVKTQEGRRQDGRCEQSSFGRPNWVRYIISHSSPQLSPRILILLWLAEHQQQTPYLKQHVMENGYVCLATTLTSTEHSQLPQASTMPYVLLSQSTSSGCTFPWWRLPELCLGECLGLIGGQAESTCGLRAAPSGSVSGNYKLVGGVWVRVAHEAFALLPPSLNTIEHLLCGRYWSKHWIRQTKPLPSWSLNSNWENRLTVDKQ